MEVFIVDEVNAMSAEMLAQLDKSMTQLFKEKRDKIDGEVKPFDGIFMEDRSHLGGIDEAVDADGHNYLKADRVI